MSTQILFQDFQTVYQQLERGECASLPLKTVSFKQWAERLTEYVHSEELKLGIEEFWHPLPWEEIAPLPLEYPEGKTADTLASSKEVSMSLNTEETVLLQQCLSADTQILDILLAALERTFFNWNTSPVLYMQIQYHGRQLVFDDLDLSRTIGYIAFGKLLLMDLSNADTVGKALQQAKTLLHDMPHQGIGLDLLQQLGDEQAQKKLPVIPRHEVVFNYTGRRDEMTSDTPFLLPVREDESALRNRQEYRDRTFYISGEIIQGQFCLTWEYGENIHRRATIEALVHHYREAL